MGEGAEHARQRFGVLASSCIAQPEIAMIPPAWAERRAWHGMGPHPKALAHWHYDAYATSQRLGYFSVNATEVDWCPIKTLLVTVLWPIAADAEAPEARLPGGFLPNSSSRHE
jgi:hypothetical protein